MLSSFNSQGCSHDRLDNKKDQWDADHNWPGCRGHGAALLMSVTKRTSKRGRKTGQNPAARSFQADGELMAKKHHNRARELLWGFERVSPALH